MARKTTDVDSKLAEACKAHDVDPAKVLDWKDYGERVVFVVEDGRKLTWSDAGKSR